MAVPPVSDAQALRSAWALWAPHCAQALLLCDGAGRLLAANPAAERWCGPPSAWLGRALDEALPLRPGELADPPGSWAARLAAGGESELCVGLADGRERWLRVALQAVPGLGHSLALTDIDELQRERRRLQAAVREGRALVETLNRHAIVSETDRDGTILRVNPRFEAISGYSAAELVGSHHRIVNSGTHPPPFWAAMWATIGRGQPWRGEICNRAKDGSLYWVDSLIAPQRGPDGRVEKFISIRHDITRLKQAKMALAASRRLLARTGRLAGVGGWFQAGRQDTLYLSVECLAIYGIRPDEGAVVPEVPGYHAFPTDHPKLAAIVQRVQRLPLPFDTVVEVASERRGRLWLRLLAEQEVDEHGQTLTIGAVLDVTAFTHAQRRAQESERTLRAAIDALGEAFALYDPQERLVFCNEPYRAMSPGVDGSTAAGVRYEDVLRAGAESATPVGVDRPEDWVAERLRRFRSPGSDQTIEMRDGRWLHLADRTTPDGFHVAFRIDVTDTQRALLAADAASRSKSQFLANMSHEIRTPMNAVLGMLRLLQFTELAPRQAELVDKTGRAARALLDILNDILDFSKVEAGKMALDPEPFVLDDLLADLSTVLSGTLGGKSLELVFDLDPALPPVLVGDALRLKQVLINLLGNAVKFTSLGEVVLRIAPVRAEADRLWLRFEVRDTGIGIDPQQQAFIFSGFFQAEASTARQYGGTGLGLAISQRLVALMGGQMALESTPGCGSSFTCELALGVLAPGTAPPAPAPGPLPAGVWLVGCHPRTQAALRCGLEALGCTVWTDGLPDTAALSLVVSEARMGADPHAALAAALQARAPGAPAPVWLQLTRGADVEAPAQPSPGGQPQHLLVKPLTVPQLLRAYRQALDGADTAAACPWPAPAAPRRLQGLRLLLVEDNAFNQEVAQEMLRREGATVAVAEHGLAALQRLRADIRAHDLVLMDMQMPVMDGLQATQAIRRLPGGAGLPIVAMTANAMAADRQACLDAGMNDHLGKPFDLDEVVRVVQAHTGRCAPPRPATAPFEPTPADPPEEDTLPVFAPEPALRRLGGDRAFFQRLLRGYPDTLRPQLAEWQAARQADDTVLAAAALHRLKSGAASTGAERLAALAARWERQCRVGAWPADALALPALADATLAAQRGAWADALAVPDPAAPPPPVAAMALQDLHALEALVRAGDLAVFDACADWVQRHGAPNGLDTQALSRAIDDFDTDAALAVIESLKNHRFDPDRP
ncbi:ATP-binding protein [Aquabacterium sp. A08]|uniref:ATP-binding protein n=1 Tax=Aquabacterium sp. A08 TaxID=2718532 RepID=UPI00141EDDD9|nr:ATP-binding protein [Aquabacterium sp. A08]NIC42886.1 response regulator [Aquabacterium sp. A08]